MKRNGVGRAVAAVAAVGVACMGLSACGGGGDESSDSAEKGPVKFGVTVALTGPAAATDESYHTGVDAAVKYINENGGVLGGRKLEAVVRDTGGDATQAAAAARELAGDDSLAFIFMEPISSGALAQAPTLNQAGIPSISMAATAELSDPKTNPWVFSFGEDSEQTAQEALAYLVETRGFDKIGLLYENNPYGQGQLAATKALIDDYDAEIVGEEGFQTGATSLSAQARKLRDAGSEGLILWTYGGGQAAAAQALESIDWHPPSVSTPGLALPVIAEAVGGRDKLENIYGYGIGKSMLRANADDELDDKASPFLDSLPDGYDGDIIQPSWGFDGVMTLAQAIDEAGSTDPEDVKKALESGTAFEGVRTSYTFTPEDHRGLDLDQIGLFDAAQECSVEAGCVAAEGLL